MKRRSEAAKENSEFVQPDRSIQAGPVITTRHAPADAAALRELMAAIDKRTRAQRVLSILERMHAHRLEQESKTTQPAPVPVREWQIDVLKAKGPE